MTQTRKIDKVFLWMITDENGNEIVLGAITEQGMFPFISTEYEKMKDLRDSAILTAKTTGFVVKFLQFDNITVLEEITNETEETEPLIN